MKICATPRASSRSTSRDPAALFEPLEPRALLAATPVGTNYDLTVGFASVTLPTVLIQGKATRANAKVTLSLTGSDPLPARQKIDLKFLLRPELGDDVPLVTLANQSLAGLTASKPNKTFTANFTVPASAPLGNYTLIALADPHTTSLPNGKLLETNEENNTATLLNATAVEVLDNELELTTASHNYAPDEDANNAGLGTVTLTNLGNTTATGNATVTFYAVADGEPDRVLGYTKVALNLKPGFTTATIKVNLTLPRSLTDGGIYDIIAELTPPTKFTGDDASDNWLLAPGDVLVYVPDLVFDDVADKLVFYDEYDRSLFSSEVYKTGKFTDGYGDSGRYVLYGSLRGDNEVLMLSLTYNSRHIRGMTLRLDPMGKNAVKSLLNKKMIFTDENNDAEGRISRHIYYDISNA